MMFSALVVLHSWLKDQSRQLNKRMRNKEAEYSETCSEIKRRQDNPVASLVCAHANKSIIYATGIGKKHQLISFPAAKHKKKLLRVFSLTLAIILLI